MAHPVLRQNQNGKLGGVRRTARGLRIRRRIGWRTRSWVRFEADEGAVCIDGRRNHLHVGDGRGDRRRRINRNRRWRGRSRKRDESAAAGIRRDCRPGRRGGLVTAVVIAVLMVLGFDRDSRCLRRHQSATRKFERHERRYEQGHRHAKFEHCLHQKGASVSR